MAILDWRSQIQQSSKGGSGQAATNQTVFTLNQSVNSPTQRTERGRMLGNMHSQHSQVIPNKLVNAEENALTLKGISFTVGLKRMMGKDMDFSVILSFSLCPVIFCD